MQAALAWPLQRSPNVLVISRIPSIEHLRENPQTSKLRIPSKAIAQLEAIGTKPTGSISRRSAAVHPAGMSLPGREDALLK